MFGKYSSEAYREKFALFGATTFWGYRWRRFVNVISPWFPFPSVLRARLHRRRWRWILPLGINCETAYRFYRKWGFVESSLFAWAAMHGIEGTLRTLRNLNGLFSGEAEFLEDRQMWRCLNTGASFHGKLRYDRMRPPTSEERAADLSDLRGRVTHLREKFRMALKERPLLIHRLSEADAESEDLDSRLEALEAEVRRLGATDYTLLVVCERRHLDRMPQGPHRLYRAVLMFNPIGHNADWHLGDSPGWQAIFTEFAPERILPKKHAFKFE